MAHDLRLCLPQSKAAASSPTSCLDWARSLGVSCACTRQATAGLLWLLLLLLVVAMAG
jgi:hypothetical protein